MRLVQCAVYEAIFISGILTNLIILRIQSLYGRKKMYGGRNEPTVVYHGSDGSDFCHELFSGSHPCAHHGEGLLYSMSGVLTGVVLLVLISLMERLKLPWLEVCYPHFIWKRSKQWANNARVSYISCLHLCPQLQPPLPSAKKWRGIQLEKGKRTKKKRVVNFSPLTSQCVRAGFKGF